MIGPMQPIGTRFEHDRELKQAMRNTITWLRSELGREQLARRSRLRALVDEPVLAGLRDMGDIARHDVEWLWPPR